jgi:hypothetical protein
MARGGTPKERHAPRELPPPLPPETRTVGQLVGETIRTYQRHPLPALAIGVLPGVFGVVEALVSGWQRFVLAWAGAPIYTLSYMLGVGVVAHVSVRGRQGVRAFVAGVLAYLPFPLLSIAFVLPGLAWLALVGLVVPVALIEGTGLRASFGRALQLGRADFVHMLGGLCTLALVVVLSQGVVFYLLRGFADNTAPTAAGLAGIVLSPLLFIGAAILYEDQTARIRSGGRPKRRSDAHVPDAHDAHREGGADAQVEPRTSA